MRALRTRLRRLEAGRGEEEPRGPILVTVNDMAVPEPGQVLPVTDYSDAAITAVTWRGGRLDRLPDETVEALLARAAAHDASAQLLFAVYAHSRAAEPLSVDHDN